MPITYFCQLAFFYFQKFTRAIETIRNAVNKMILDSTLSPKLNS